MADTIAKTVTITDGSTELEIPAASFKPTLTNNITSFNNPFTDGGKRETRALNMNRIGVKIQVTAKVDDNFAAKNHNGSGDRPNLSNKEDWLDTLYTMFLSGDILELKATNSKTSPQISEFSGYLHNLDWKEESREVNSIYDVTLKFQDEVPMNS